MPNHFHFLVRERKEKGISDFMQKLMTGYSMYFNKKYERRGTLFEGPFKAEHANSDTYLKYLFAYIHLNPVNLIESKWRESGVQNLKKVKHYLREFPYSSYPEYLGDIRPQSLILNQAEFPDYFRNSFEFKKQIWEWLTFSKAKVSRRGLDTREIKTELA
jgi:putative transposase